MKLIIAAAVIGICAGSALADPAPAPATIPAPTPESGETEVVVAITPTRHAEPVASATSAVTVITRKQIEDKKPFDITDIIAMAPSLSLSQTGDRGKEASVFLRGASPEEVLVLIDGVRVNSPSTGEFDFGTVPIENIERIEVLRGPQSGLYGSDAMGGVINIITRRGEGPFQTGGSAEYGSFNTNREEYTARGSVGNGGLSFALTRAQTDGSYPNDDFNSLSSSLRFDHPLTGHSSLSFTGQAQQVDVGVPGEVHLSFDPNEREPSHDFLGNLQFKNTAGNRQDQVTVAAYDKTLHDDNPLNPGIPLADNSESNSLIQDRVLSLEAQSSWNLGFQTLTAGTEIREESANFAESFNVPPPAFSANFDKSTNTKAIFVQDELHRGRFSVVPSLREEDNSQFGNNLSGRLAGGYALDAKSRLKASIGTGFRAPAFEDLYFPGFNNPNLQPEKSVGYDVGYARTLPNQGEAEVTLFRNNFRDLITDNALGPINIDHATTEGLELAYNQRLNRNWKAIVNQSFMNTNSDGSSPPVRRPKFTTGADLVYRQGRFNSDLGLVAQGRRYDIAPDFSTQQYGGFTRFDYTLSYDLTAGRQVYVRIGNLLNHHYEPVTGFPAEGLNFVVGYQVREF